MPGSGEQGPARIARGSHLVSARWGAGQTGRLPGSRVHKLLFGQVRGKWARGEAPGGGLTISPPQIASLITLKRLGRRGISNMEIGEEGISNMETGEEGHKQHGDWGGEQGEEAR